MSSEYSLVVRPGSTHLLINSQVFDGKIDHQKIRQEFVKQVFDQGIEAQFYCLGGIVVQAYISVILEDNKDFLPVFQAIGSDGKTIAHLYTSKNPDNYYIHQKGYGQRYGHRDRRKQSDPNEVQLIRAKYEGNGIVATLTSICAESAIHDRLSKIYGEVSANPQSLRSRQSMIPIIGDYAYKTYPKNGKLYTTFYRKI